MYALFFSPRESSMSRRILQLASERLEVRIAQMSVFGYSATSAIAIDVSPTLRRRGVPHSRADRHLRGDSAAPTSWSRPFLVVVSVGWVSVVGEGCGPAGQQQIEDAVEFGGAVVGGEGGGRCPQ